MINILRKEANHTDFIYLVQKLDAELAERDGEDHSFYAQFNKIDKLKNIVVAYSDSNPIACGALKDYKPGIMEIKRMYTLPEYRGRGIGTKILNELEQWTLELNGISCILETGKRQIEAIHLYKKNGYTLIPNFDQYIGDENSQCYEKRLV